MMKTKIFAAYLPQYHETEDNNKFWGKGFTDWMAVKNAVPQFEGHRQPKIPLGNNYYDLSNIETIRWQADLANEYGIDGFNIYHYWFKDGQQELEKPAEMLLAHPEIKIQYFFSWDNAPWIRTWSNVIKGNAWSPVFDNDNNKGRDQKSDVLVDFDYGDETQWKQHFEYLLPYFQDNRYFKIENKPVFLFFVQNKPQILKRMGEFWNQLAQKNGFQGVFLGVKKRSFFNSALFEKQFLYEPLQSAWAKRAALDKRLLLYFGIKARRDNPVRYIYDYDKVWSKIIKNAKNNVKQSILCAFVRYDDTPRRGKEAGIVLGESPEKFECYFRQLYDIACENNNPFMLLTAWNEWGEGAYLEPDEKDGYAYLEALRDAVGGRNV